MNSDIYLAYVDAAQRHGAASMAGDHVAANKAHSLLMKALKQIRMQPDRGAERLTQLLESTDSFVVCWAGTFSSLSLMTPQPLTNPCPALVRDFFTYPLQPATTPADRSTGPDTQRCRGIPN